VGSRLDLTKPKTMQLISAAYPLRTQH